MTELFDSYRSNYRDVVQSSLDFPGLPHSFFMQLVDQLEVAKNYYTTRERKNTKSAERTQF